MSSKMDREILEKRFIHPIATVLLIIGSMGLFPEVPVIVYETILPFPFLRWILVFVLVWQGGGGKDVKTSAIVTIGTFAVYTILNSMRGG